jgi:CheY-like chemotaxis protein
MRLLCCARWRNSALGVETAPKQEGSMRNPVVLCVDDDLDGLMGREALLEQKGYDVLISTSPREGLKLFASCRVDAVVLDYQIPEMCGDVVASRMKQLKPEIPIMLLSAHDGLDDEALPEVDMFLSKREPPWKFVEAVQVLLAAREHLFSRWLRDWKRKLAVV